MTLFRAAAGVLATADAADKAHAARAMAESWRRGTLSDTSEGRFELPDRPARPARPELRLPRDMPKRGRGFSEKNRIALLHALAHIELNAIDLACDLIARFGPDCGLPRDFLDDWVRVADEEAKHYLLLAERLGALDAAYGDLPAHDGLWQAAGDTAGNLLARLAVVPLVLEARGLDVTPTMIRNLRRAEDEASAEVLEIIYRDEIGHVDIGRRWFEHECATRGIDPVDTWHRLVKAHFKGALKPPFNDDARAAAGFGAEYYASFADAEI